MKEGISRWGVTAECCGLWLVLRGRLHGVPGGHALPRASRKQQSRVPNGAFSDSVENGDWIVARTLGLPLVAGWLRAGGLGGAIGSSGRTSRTVFPKGLGIARLVSREKLAVAFRVAGGLFLISGTFEFHDGFVPNRRLRKNI